jgi:HD superfamily phosphohydrolase YqeK
VDVRAYLHPVIEAAGRRGELPDWAECDPSRRAHVERVADLMETWAAETGQSETEKIRWRAAGLLHDALKDADTGELAALAGVGWPEPLLHAPACAARLRADGVDDQELLLAVTWHSVGHPEFGDLGVFLYLADFLEPGREGNEEERARLVAQLPEERATVLPAVMALRLGFQLRERRPLLQPSVDLWNRATAS